MLYLIIINLLIANNMVMFIYIVKQTANVEQDILKHPCKYR